ncbi:alpha/beta fold hydrolase [Ornithinimicrobium sp. LYQ92]|uniref:alpha/beta fold hydrolase n=1 Tax=Serinicoccus sp. LYQ92 TaxID=3378798 RepID=UPI0038553AAB
MTPPTPAQDREYRLPVDGAELCVQGFGAPADPTLLLVAGAAGSMDGWEDEFCLGIARGGRRVVRYDHRDTGASSWDPPGAPTYDGEQLTRDCLALVGHLVAEGGPVHLVGLSMGGGIVQSVALQHPELVASLTLIATSAIGGLSEELPGPMPVVASFFAQPPVAPDPGDHRSLLTHLVEAERPFAGGLGFDEERATRVARRVLARSASPASADNHWLVITGDEDPAVGLPPDVHHLRVPTLVLHGSDDPLFPLPHGRALAAAVPGARLVVLQGMGHEYPPPALHGVVVQELLTHTDPSVGDRG